MGTASVGRLVLSGIEGTGEPFSRLAWLLWFLIRIHSAFKLRWLPVSDPGESYWTYEKRTGLAACVPSAGRPMVYAASAAAMVAMAGPSAILRVCVPVPKFRLGPGKSVTLHTGSGRNTKQHVYWRQDWYVWNNDGDRAILKNRAGNRVDVCSWGDGDGNKPC